MVETGTQIRADGRRYVIGEGPAERGHRAAGAVADHAGDLSLHGGGIKLAEFLFEDNWDSPDDGNWADITNAVIQFTIPPPPLSVDLVARVPLLSTVATDDIQCRAVDVSGNAFFGAISGIVKGNGLVSIDFPVPYTTRHTPTPGTVKTYKLQAKRTGSGQLSVFVDFGGSKVASGFFRAVQH